ncbi:hypothetical protein [Lumpy skin disease virus]|uniref:LS054 n=1 Tax=Lumpy skin disease virus TaxID=59509 RepID=A0A1C9HHB6_LSDV|nr:hypothetical protein [Lumpy skin disease virus]AOO78614.1 hypothetical protein [Lumpy skin disease virus]AOO78773.1 hypothetical protein [Lumpy skin disease virus]AOO78931.1 hypothetical protein [Lumpy skin disease virus]AVR51491.1 hypothetical protein [Lumpy skin disease virus]
MGIKNLKTVLVEIGALHQIKNVQENIINGIFVDTMSFFVSIAHCVNNLDDLYEGFMLYISQWKKQGKITLFVDRGVIPIKESLREKRRNASRNTSKKNVLEIEKLNNLIKNLNVDDMMYDEIKTDLELKIKKLEFNNYLANHVQLKDALDNSLKLLGSDVTIIYCDGIDAEFVMCQEAKKIAYITEKWPLMISTDQDTLLFSSCDDLPKNIRTMNQIYSFIPCAKTRYLSKLVALTNGCDYFQGLYGFSITAKSLKSIKLFDDFTIDNVIKSLIIRNYSRKETDRYINAEKIIHFINKYSCLNESIYNEVPPESITVQEFIFSALYHKWKKFDDSLLKGISLCCSLICVLKPKKDIKRNEISKLCNIINNDSNKKSSLNNIKSVIDIFGYDLNKNKNIVYGISKLKKIMLCYDDLFYFNNENIIRNNLKKNGIINIS